MIRADMIPDEVVEAAARSMGWTSAIVLPQDRLRFKGHIAAALNAWTGSFPWTFNGPLTGTGFVLPLPQGAAAPLEPRDE